MSVYECGLRDCDAQLASDRPVKLWHGLDGSHAVQYLDDERANSPTPHVHPLEASDGR